MNPSVSGPLANKPSQGPATSKTSKSGRLNFGAVTAKVTNLTSESTKSPISEAAKHTDTPTPLRQKGGTRAKLEAAKLAYTPSTNPFQQTSETTSSHAHQTAIESAASSKDFIEHSLAEDLSGSGLLFLRREPRETDRRRRVDSKTGKTSEEDEESAEKEHLHIKNIGTTEEREGGGQEKGQYQNLLDRLEQLAREGKRIGPQNIIDIAWGKKGVYEDVTEAYDGLRRAQQHFAEKDEDVLKNFSHSTRAAGDVLYKDNGPDIRTGYLFGPGTDETISYRESVIRFEKVSDSFKTIMDKVEGNPNLFTKEIDKLVKLIQIDMKAQESTLDPSHLKQIMQGLFQVQMCSQIKTDCEILLRDMVTLYPSAPQN